MGPLDLLRQYRQIMVNTGITEDPVAAMSRPQTVTIQLRTYFMMSWREGTEQLRDYNEVVRGPSADSRTHAGWFRQNSQSIRTAAMGKGRPGDYGLALEWAVRSGRINRPSQASIQTWCDQHLGLDCSGFATNFLCLAGRMAFSHHLVGNKSAMSYYDVHKAVNDPTAVRQGDLLVWMDGDRVKQNPGHVAVVETYTPQSATGGNMRVVEATGAAGANPKILDSQYAVEQITMPAERRGVGPPVMILTVRRHGISGNRVAVMRW